MAKQALMKVHGVGPSTADEWYRRGIRTIDDAIAAGVMNAQCEARVRSYDLWVARALVPATLPSPYR